jgi:Asp-tRNA(Asn)/Glu-tRNA(Gln) amidotransferase A subunit family amidase
MAYTYNQTRYSYDHRIAKSTPEVLKRQYDFFAKVLKVMEGHAPNLTTPYTAKATLEDAYRQVAGHLQLLLLGVLQTYQLDDKSRKILEKASKSFGKTRIVVKRETAIETFAQTLKDWRIYHDIIEKALASGEVHQEGEWKAGPFNLINTGGFDPQVMQEAVKVVEKAASSSNPRDSPGFAMGTSK